MDLRNGEGVIQNGNFYVNVARFVKCCLNENALIIYFKRKSKKRRIADNLKLEQLLRRDNDKTCPKGKLLKKILVGFQCFYNKIYCLQLELGLKFRPNVAQNIFVI